MVTITKVEEKVNTYNGKTKKSYVFTLSDGVSGYASNDKPWEFKEGESVTYTKEVKKSSKGEYNLFTFTRVSESAPTQDSTPKPERPQIHVGSGKSVQELKAEAAIRSMEFMLNAFIQNKVDWGQMQEKQTYLANILWMEIDDIFGTKK